MLLLTVLAASLHAQPATLTLESEVNRQRIYLGESVVFSVRVKGIDDQNMRPDLSKIENCEIKFLGTHSESRFTAVIRNGMLRQEGYSGRLFVYEITPRREGAVHIGPVFLQTADGRRISHQGVVINVRGIEDQDQVLLNIIASREEVLVDEPFRIDLEVLIKTLPPPFSGTQPVLLRDPPRLDVPYLEVPPPEGLEAEDLFRKLGPLQAEHDQPGFHLNRYTSRPRFFSFPSMIDPMERRGERPVRFAFPAERINTNGTAYIRYSFSMEYRPAKEGLYTFGPALFKGPVIVAIDNRRQPITSDVFAIGPAVTVRVVPPPEEGRPASYYGAIGRNLDVRANLDSRHCRVGDPLTLSLELRGDVRFENVTRPQLTRQDNLSRKFRVYDETARTQRTDDGINYEYIVRPLLPGTYEMPPVEIAFFDIDTRSYRIAASAPVPLRADPAPELDASMIIGMEALRPAMRHDEYQLRVAPLLLGTSLPHATPLPGTGWWLLFLAGPLILLAARLQPHAGALRRAWRIRLRSSIALRKAMHELQKNPTAENPPAICWQIVRQYLAERLDRETSHITPSDIPQLLPDKVEPALRDEFSSFSQELFDAVYLGGKSAAAKPGGDDVKHRTEELLIALDRALTEKRNSVQRKTTAGGIVAVLLCAGALTAGAGSSEIRFYREAAETLARSARNRQDYAAAAEAYEKLLALGERDGIMLYNLGTLHLLAGNSHKAADAFIRAERYLGYRWYIAHNLAQTWEDPAAMTDEEISLPWYRHLFAWHFALGIAARLRLFITFSFAGCLLAALAIRGNSPAARGSAGVLFILTLLAASSALVSLFQEQQAALHSLPALASGQEVPDE